MNRAQNSYPWGSYGCGMGKGFISSWSLPGLACHTTAPLQAEAKGGTNSAIVGAWKSHPCQDMLNWSPWFSSSDC